MLHVCIPAAFSVWTELMLNECLHDTLKNASLLQTINAASVCAKFVHVVQLKTITIPEMVMIQKF